MGIALSLDNRVFGIWEQPLEVTCIWPVTDSRSYDCIRVHVFFSVSEPLIVSSIFRGPLAPGYFLSPYAVMPLVRAMNAVSRFSSSSQNNVSLKPASTSAVGNSL
jgi:hypothetical protein